MSSGNNDLFGWSVVGFGAGIFCFFKGFRVYRKYRVLADTPVMPIRSIPMGLVEIHGKAQGPERLTSPVTRTPCFLYKVDIERWETDSKGRGRWSQYKTDVNGVKFYLQDATGKVLVDGRGAELDLMKSGRRQTQVSGLTTRNLTPRRTTDYDLEAYVANVGAGGVASLLESLKEIPLGGGLSFAGSGASSGRYRLTEYCLLPDHWYDVTGSCTENPNPKDEHDRNLIVKGQNEPTFLISWRSEKEIEKTLRMRAAGYIFGGAALAIVCLAIVLAQLGWF